MKVICPVCGTEFEGARRDMACSPECRKKRDRERNRERQKRMYQQRKEERLLEEPAPSRTCPDCGKPITDYRCPDCWAKKGRPAHEGGFEEYTSWLK